jgi:hypothetical protein
MHDPSRQTEAQQAALKEAKEKAKQECETAFRRGFEEGSQGRIPSVVYRGKDLIAAYQCGYSKGEKGMKIKL